MKRYIFLDVDGVMNCDDWYYNERIVKNNWKCGDYNPQAISLLNQLEDCEVVISSSWGKDADKPLMDLGLKLPIVGHIEHIYYGHRWLCRGNAIAKWIEDNVYSKQIESYEYVIFDDDKDMLLSQEENFV